MNFTLFISDYNRKCLTLLDGILTPFLRLLRLTT